MSAENSLKYSDNFNICLGTTDKSITSAVIKEGCKKIEIESFSRCNLLEKVYLPNSLASIGMFAFNECTNLKEINLENTKIKVLYPGVFQNCKNLENITLPDTLEEVNRTIFAFTKIKELVLPKDVKRIKNFFLEESSVEKVILPDNLKQVDNHAFDCDTLQIIVYGKQNDFIMDQLRNISKKTGISLAESDLDYLISNKSFKEINKLYKEKEIEI